MSQAEWCTEALTSKAMVFGDGASGMTVGSHEVTRVVFPWWDGCPYKKKHRELAVSLSLSATGGHLQVSKGTSLDTDRANALNLGFQPPKRGQN